MPLNPLAFIFFAMRETERKRGEGNKMTDKRTENVCKKERERERDETER